MRPLINKIPLRQTILWLLVLSFSLRALVPQGYMIEKSDTSPAGFAIVICDGITGILASQSLADNVSSHEAHLGHMAAGDTAPVSTGHENHLNSHGDCTSCGFWLASSTFVESADLAIDGLIADPVDVPVSEYNFIQTTKPQVHSHSSRGPPLII
ncbi:MAG: hypothetical protein OEZ23_02645 [Gammaproteobacteria bacterium]|nr:hypothetical protein [Gammaproteobacteria bacterium]